MSSPRSQCGQRMVGRLWGEVRFYPTGYWGLGEPLTMKHVLFLQIETWYLSESKPPASYRSPNRGDLKRGSTSIFNLFYEWQDSIRIDEECQYIFRSLTNQTRFVSDSLRPLSIRNVKIEERDCLFGLIIERGLLDLIIPVLSSLISPILFLDLLFLIILGRFFGQRPYFLQRVSPRRGKIAFKNKL